MAMLQLIQQAAGEMGLAVPTFVAGNTQQDTVQQLALLNAVGHELQRQYDWQKSVVEYRFSTQYLTTTGTTTAGSAVVTGLGSTVGLDSTYSVIGTGINQDTYVLTGRLVLVLPTQVTLTQPASASGTVTLKFCKTKYAAPPDYDRTVDRTQWDKSKHWEMLGPETAQQWQWLKSGYISTGPRVRYRQVGGTFQIWPPVSTSEYLGFEYISKYWAQDVSGIAQVAFALDTDTSIFPDRLLVLGLKLKYFEAKGFDTTAYYRDYIRELDISKANDAGSQTLSFAPRLSTVLIGVQSLPDSGFGT